MVGIVRRKAQDIEELRAGVVVWTGQRRGVIVFNNTIKSYAAGQNEAHCQRIGKGFMIRLEGLGMIYQKDFDPELEIELGGP